MAPQKTLVIGAGELGFQVLHALTAHPSTPATIALLLRPGSINSVQLIPGDIVENSEETLASILASYDTVIGCTGFVSSKAIQTKLARAVIAAEIPRYIPRQFDVDYDAIGRGSPQDLSDEQLDVRDLLRAPGQTKTRWTIISTGMFTSFLFESSFGVVNQENGVINASGSLESRVTVTTPEDIGVLTAEIVMRDLFDNQPIFIGGDTVSYERLAQIIDAKTGKPFKGNVLGAENVLAALSKDPDNGLLKYQAIFGQGRGVAWDVASTWSKRLGIHTESVEEWLTKNWA